MEIWRGAFRGEERNDDQSKREMEARGVGGTQGSKPRGGTHPGGREMERERRRSGEIAGKKRVRVRGRTGEGQRWGSIIHSESGGVRKEKP